MTRNNGNGHSTVSCFEQRPPQADLFPSFKGWHIGERPLALPRALFNLLLKSNFSGNPIMKVIELGFREKLAVNF